MSRRKYREDSECGAYAPTPAEIAAAAEQIRRSWSPAQERVRAGLPPDRAGKGTIEILEVWSRDLPNFE